MKNSTKYQIVPLKNGGYSIRCLAAEETYHPVVGPSAEAESLYVRQLRLVERFRATPARHPFTIWDVGLGAGANILTGLWHLRHEQGSLQIFSFDRTRAALAFALDHADQLGYFHELQGLAREFLDTSSVLKTTLGHLQVQWNFVEGDFTQKLASTEARHWKSPDVIFYDPHSPAKNPEMWTLPLFKKLFSALDPGHPCSLATYSRSTFLRVTLLRAGFWVGAGDATGPKEETTIAANDRALIQRPLGEDWLRRAKLSRSAEPLHEATYSQQPLSEQSLAEVLAHEQFRA